MLLTAEQAAQKGYADTARHDGRLTAEQAAQKSTATSTLSGCTLTAEQAAQKVYKIYAF